MENEVSVQERHEEVKRCSRCKDCRVNGATLYCTHQPCVLCAKMIVNSGIKRVVYDQGYPDDFSLEIFRDGGVIIEKWEEEQK